MTKPAPTPISVYADLVILISVSIGWLTPKGNFPNNTLAQEDAPFQSLINLAQWDAFPPTYVPWQRTFSFVTHKPSKLWERLFGQSAPST